MEVSAKRCRQRGRGGLRLYAVGGSEPEKKRKLEKGDPILVLATHSKDPVPNLAPRKKQTWLESI